MEHTSTAVVFESPGELTLRDVTLPPCGPEDCVVEVEWTGISTGTERLLWDGRMPHFPGLDYPLVPGYETVGRVLECGEQAFLKPGCRVFVPGSRGFTDVHGIFGGAAKQLVVAASRVVPLPDSMGEEATLLALAATAAHALDRLLTTKQPLLVVGHGVLGQLLARIAVARGLSDISVWETQSARRQPVQGYRLIDPEQDHV
ncbi:MAG: alcohol dehydrogenase catalytic domain-containing protein, partial [Halieaceae bacterium]|nr:alcohol dehydrogenase catalytic domain-containing protein [Halieaceae bacterium]